MVGTAAVQQFDRIAFKKRYVKDYVCWRHTWVLYINKIKQVDFLIVSTTWYNDGYWVYDDKENRYIQRFDTLYEAKRYVLTKIYG
jgi:hypothetical protein